MYHYAANNPVKYTDPDGRVHIETQLLALNPNGNRPGTKLIKPKSVVIHWTGVPEQTAQQTRNFFGLPSTETSAHYVVGQEGEIIQMIPDDEVAYHAGGIGYLTDFAKDNYSENNVAMPNKFTIGIEVNPMNSKGEYTEEARLSSVKLAASVIRRNEIGGFLSILFGGVLVRHGDITGKDCPKLYMNDDQEWFFFKLSVAIEYLKIKIFGEKEDE